MKYKHTFLNGITFYFENENEDDTQFKVLKDDHSPLCSHSIDGVENLREYINQGVPCFKCIESNLTEKSFSVKDFNPPKVEPEDDIVAKFLMSLLEGKSKTLNSEPDWKRLQRDLSSRHSNAIVKIFEEDKYKKVRNYFTDFNFPPLEDKILTEIHFK